MAEEKQQDGQKTIVAFVVGLLIGGMLVWAFSGPSTEAPTMTDPSDEAAEETAADDESEAESDTAAETDTPEAPTETPALSVGDGDIVVNNQPAGTSIALERATYPVSEGWVGVREFNNEQLGFILGVVRFSESKGLVPQEIILQRPTTPGRNYAVVVFTEDGDFDFNLANDAQIDTIFDTFTAE
jgi:hypothetical protein